MKEFWKYAKKYPYFVIGILFLIGLSVVDFISGSVVAGSMVIPLIMAYCFWFSTQIDCDNAWELVDQAMELLQKLNAKYNNLIEEYNDLVDDYNELQNNVNSDTVEVELVDDQTES